LRSIGSRILVFYLATTAFAFFVGITLSRVVNLGVGFQFKGEAPSQAITGVPNFLKVLVEMVPKNVFSSFSNGSLVQIVIFGAFLGVVILLMPEGKKKTAEDFFRTFADIFLQLVKFVLGYAPIGVGALMAGTMGVYGSKVIGPLAKFIGTVYLGYIIQIILAYFVMLYIFTRMNPFQFLKKTYALYVTTASTCSSLASLPINLQVAKENLGVPEEVANFTLPLGAAINKDGGSITMACALGFAAGATGMALSIPTQISMIFIGTLMSMGGSGIPGGGIVIIMILTKAFNLPVEIGAILAGIYRLTDMGGTTMNCMGDLVGTYIVGHSFKPKKS